MRDTTPIATKKNNKLFVKANTAWSRRAMFGRTSGLDCRSRRRGTVEDGVCLVREPRVAGKYTPTRESFWIFYSSSSRIRQGRIALVGESPSVTLSGFGKIQSGSPATCIQPRSSVRARFRVYMSSAAQKSSSTRRRRRQFSMAARSLDLAAAQPHGKRFARAGVPAHHHRSFFPPS